MDIKESARNTYKEIARMIDVIELKPVDIDNIKEENKFIFTMGYILMIYHLSRHATSYMKFESLVLRLFWKGFDELNEQVRQIIGEFHYGFYLDTIGSIILTLNFFDDFNAFLLNATYFQLSKTFSSFSCSPTKAISYSSWLWSLIIFLIQRFCFNHCWIPFLKGGRSPPSPSIATGLGVDPLKNLFRKIPCKIL